MKIMQRLFLRHHIVFFVIAAVVLVTMESQADTEIEIKHLINPTTLLTVL
jgi:hypothetical protein